VVFPHAISVKDKDITVKRLSIFVLMHELPLENAGGGVLLREILRFLARDYRVTALFPAYPHQIDIINKLVPEIEHEGMRAFGLPLRDDWGCISFSLARLLSLQPGSVCAMKSAASCALIKKLLKETEPDYWLLISPFAAAYLPETADPDKVCLYYTNVDEDIMVPRHGSLRQRLDGWLEKFKVRLYVRHTAGLAGKRAAITEQNSKVLTRKIGLGVCYLPPLMAPRIVNRSTAQTGLALITTNYTYAHNRISMEWFFREVWSKVANNVRLEVTGLDTPDGHLRQLCDSVPRVCYLGFVSKSELDQAFARSSIVINPTISGSGFQIKLLDALARGIPVVSTSFSNPIGKEINCSDDPQDFARVISLSTGSRAASVFQYREFYINACESWKDFIEKS
jgi:hypothetical protein